MILDWTQILIINLALTVGASLQGAIGYGMGLLVSPVLLLVEPRLIPGPFLLAATFEIVLMMLRERQALDLFGLRWRWLVVCRALRRARFCCPSFLKRSSTWLLA